MKKKTSTITIVIAGVVLLITFLGIARKEIVDYRNRGVDVTNDESIRVPIENLAEEFANLDFSKETVKSEEIILNKEVAYNYNSKFNSTVEYNLDKDLNNMDVEVKKILKEYDGDYKVNFHVEYMFSYTDGSNNKGGGTDDYTAYVVEKDGKFYIDRIIDDVNLGQFKNEKSKLTKLFASEEKLFNQAIDFEIESRKLYDEYKKSENS
ncbi:hypothetical protein GNF80_05800 [Clostridium perfringens]|nr:hypothetical protein [Clostridium perfringens]